MVFSSIEFLAFFMIVILIMLFMQSSFIDRIISAKAKINIKHLILLISSYIFYGWWDWRFCFLMLSLTIIAYLSSIKISENKYVKFYKVLGIVFPLIILGIFKYFSFFIESFAIAFNIRHIHSIKIILPVGISFFTFQALSYVIDVVNKKTTPCKSFIKLALYIAFFPQLVAGPIVKSAYFLPQLEEDKKITGRGVNDGIQIFVFGLLKKVVIADTIAIFVDQVFEFPLCFSSSTILLAIIAYSIQIYCDFSGYSDMAVGVAKILGYELPCNFNLPYISRNVSEFWKRWHISLSSWLQEYLYFSLGGSRRGELRTYINLMITMMLGGLWHGANWTFIAWGTLHGVALCIHKYYVKHIGKKYDFKINSILSIALTYAFVCSCWVFFRCDTFSQVYDIFRQLFWWNNYAINHMFIPAIVFIIGIAIATGIAIKKSKLVNGKRAIRGFYPIMDLSSIKGLTALFITIGLILGLAYTGASPFIYFQF